MLCGHAPDDLLFEVDWFKSFICIDNCIIIEVILGSSKKSFGSLLVIYE